MSISQGGYSFNASGGKKGVLSRFKCSICGRSYKIEEMMKRHEKQCIAYNR